MNESENNITYHLQNIFKTGELEENSTRAKIAQVQTEGIRSVTRNIAYCTKFRTKII